MVAARSFASRAKKGKASDQKEVAEQLKKIEERLADSDKEAYGKKQRGRGPIHSLLRAEAPSNTKRKRVNLKVAEVELKTLLYTRHALRNGFLLLRDMNERDLAQSFLGENFGRTRIDINQAKIILLEQWRYNHSGTLEHVKKKHEEYLERRRVQEENYARTKARKEELAAQESGEEGISNVVGSKKMDSL